MPSFVTSPTCGCAAPSISTCEHVCVHCIVNTAAAYAVMAAPSTGKPVVCLACGDDLSNRSGDRRTLLTASLQHVVPLWMSIVSKELAKRNETAELESLVSGDGDVEQAGKMCRKCFSAYERLLKVQTLVEANLSKAIQVIVPTASRFVDSSQDSRKRGASNNPLSQPSAKRRSAAPPVFVASTSTSPDVAVSS